MGVNNEARVDSVIHAPNDDLAQGVNSNERIYHVYGSVSGRPCHLRVVLDESDEAVNTSLHYRVVGNLLPRLSVEDEEEVLEQRFTEEAYAALRFHRVTEMRGEVNE